MTALAAYQPTVADLTTQALILALAEVFADHQAEFIATAKHLVKDDRHIAEEVVQEAYVQALSDAKDISSGDPDVLVAWMQRAIADIAAAANRGRFEAEAGDPAVLRAQYKATDQVLAALKTVTPIDRFVLVLVAAGFTYQQIAQASHDASVSNVEEGINAARTLLAQVSAEPARRCQKTRERAGAYVDQTLSMKDRGAIERHTDSCRDCALLIDRMVEQRDTLALATPRALRALDDDALPVSARHRLTTKTDAPPPAITTMSPSEPAAAVSADTATVIEVTNDIPAEATPAAAPVLEDLTAPDVASDTPELDEEPVGFAALVDAIVAPSPQTPELAPPTDPEPDDQPPPGDTGELEGLAKLVARFDGEGMSFVDDTGEIPVAIAAEPQPQPVLSVEEHIVASAPTDPHPAEPRSARVPEPVVPTPVAASPVAIPAPIPSVPGVPTPELTISESEVVTLPGRSTPLAAKPTSATQRRRRGVGRRLAAKPAVMFCVCAAAAFAVMSIARNASTSPTTEPQAAITNAAATAQTPPPPVATAAPRATAPRATAHVKRVGKTPAKPVKRTQTRTVSRPAARPTYQAPPRRSSGGSSRGGGSGAAAEFTP